MNAPAADFVTPSARVVKNHVRENELCVASFDPAGIEVRTGAAVRGDGTFVHDP